MKTTILILITILSLAIQHFLSTRKNFIFGLILPVFTVLGCILFLIFIADPGTTRKWIFKFAMLLVVTLSIYFEGREKLKNRNRKELDRMTIKDL